MVGAVESVACFPSIAFRLLAKLPEFAFESICRHFERLGGYGDVAAGRVDCFLDAVLQLPFLNLAVERSLADAEQPSRLLAIAGGQFQRLLRIVTFHFRERSAY